MPIEIHKMIIVFSDTFCYTYGAEQLLLRNSHFLLIPKGHTFLETYFETFFCGIARRICLLAGRLRFRLQQLYLVCGHHPGQSGSAGGIRSIGRDRLRKPVQRPCPEGSGRPAAAGAVRPLGGLCRSAHLYLLSQRQPVLYRCQGCRRRICHHRRRFRFCLPADVPGRDQLPLRRGIFRHREQCRRAERRNARNGSGRIGSWGADAGVPAECTGRKFPLQAHPARCHALRRSVLQQHPGHLWPEHGLHPVQRKLLHLQLDFQRPVPAAGAIGQPHRQPASGAKHQRRRAIRRAADLQRKVLRCTG